jgi:hypothetical protein
MAKYTDAMVNRIVELKETTDLTVQQICDTVKITKETYYQWIKTKPDFSDALKEADEKRLDMMKQMAREMAFKKLKGYDVQEEKIEYEKRMVEEKDADGEKRLVEKPVIKSKTVTKKHVVGSDTLIMYLLNNTDSDNFRHKEHHEHTGKGGSKLFDFSKMSNDELKERADALEKVEKDEAA